MASTPSLLSDIVKWLRDNPVVLTSKHTDGRSNSTDGERIVIDELINAGFPVDHADDRLWKDIEILPDPSLIVDIKLIDMDEDDTGSGGSNAISGGSAFIKAMVNSSEIRSAGWNKVYDMLHNNPVDPNANLWFIVINKQDTSEVLLREVGQINRKSAIWNPRNGLQINWANERFEEPTIRTPKRRKQWLVAGIKRFLRNSVKGLKKWL